MSVRFKAQYFSFNRILEMHEDLENPSKSYAKVLFSSSWKPGNSEKRRYSDWIARFYGSATIGLSELKKGDFLVVDGSFSREAFEKDGKRVYPDASMTVFEWHKYKSGNQPKELSPEDDIPF